MTNGFGVDLSALQSLEDSVRAAVSQLSDMNPWGFEAAGKQGAGLATECSDAANDCGDPNLEAALCEFGGRWELGLRTLVQDGLTAADLIAEVRAEYQTLDDNTALEVLRIVGGL
ncbi:hypothetical protein GCM10011581_08290 [Saccharopolyspora subtropica]|uniref:Uncharacterized protein n=1 Tax=Saccharopolyspora thermophila TaxID=89367 RepID=A0A917JJZ4_9PSEU|nr:hypothetical protein [Saccharopolyspora subtropica]GGI73627.1 hypothetical protein GCM10011581_08290 [Saccharopolyspora subtropica]